MKGQVCHICTSPNRVEVDRRILKHEAPLAIARKLGIPKSSVYRHRDHMLWSRTRASPEAYQHKLEERVDQLYEKTVKLEKAAIGVGNLTAWASSLKEMRAAIELEARLSGGFAATVHRHVVEGQVEVRQHREDALAALSPAERRTLSALARKLTVARQPQQQVIDVQATPLESGPMKTWEEVDGPENTLPGTAKLAAAQAEDAETPLGPWEAALAAREQGGKPREKGPSVGNVEAQKTKVEAPSDPP